jgi:DegV family protein with EDD domain
MVPVIRRVQHRPPTEEAGMGIRVVSDSACDLPPALCAELGIEIVPLTIRFGTDELVDRVELTTAAFWERLARSNVVPETAAPSVGAFESTFRSLHDGGADGIICINLSSRMSATMQSAQIAAKALDGVCPVSVIDSKSASMGIGMLCIEAARRASEGADLDTIVAAVEDARGRGGLLFTVDTLEYLRKGGRIGGAQALLGSMLSIKPVITVRDGAVEPVGKVRTRSKALRFVVDHVKERPVETLCVLHAQAADVDDFIAMLEPIVPARDIVVGEIGPVVGVHTGPGTIGVTWLEASTSR